MKKLNLIAGILFPVLAAFAITACSSDEPVIEDEPAKGPDMFYPADSTFLYEILKEATGLEDGFLDGRLLINFVDTVNNMPHEPRFYMKVKGVKDENGQWRIWGLELYCYEYTYPIPVIPESIKNLDYLTDLFINGEGWTGYMPDYIAEIKNLKNLNIRCTSFYTLPDDLFTEDMLTVSIIGNNNIVSLPSSVTRLTNKWEGNRAFIIAGNESLSGKVPPITKAAIGMWANAFTSFDYNGVRKRHLGPDGKVYVTGAWLEGCHINELVPDSILSDTVALCDFRSQLGGYQEGGLPANLPSDEEIEKMRKEYIRNHPEDSLFAAIMHAQER